MNFLMYSWSILPRILLAGSVVFLSHSLFAQPTNISASTFGSPGSGNAAFGAEIVIISSNGEVSFGQVGMINPNSSRGERGTPQLQQNDPDNITELGSIDLNSGDRILSVTPIRAERSRGLELGVELVILSAQGSVYYTEVGMFDPERNSRRREFGFATFRQSDPQNITELGSIELAPGDRVLSTNPVRTEGTREEGLGVELVILSAEGSVYYTEVGMFDPERNSRRREFGFATFRQSDPQNTTELGSIELAPGDRVLSTNPVRAEGTREEGLGVELVILSAEGSIYYTEVGMFNQERNSRGPVRGYSQLEQSDPQSITDVGDINLFSGESIVSANLFGSPEARDTGFGVELVIVSADGSVSYSEVGMIDPNRSSSGPVRGYPQLEQSDPSSRTALGSLNILESTCGSVLSGEQQISQ